MAHLRLEGLIKVFVFLMRASTASREEPTSSLARNASRFAIQLSACSASRLNSCEMCVMGGEGGTVSFQ